ncbi:MAG TPA: phage holin family protein [Burkholderiales bacterium]|nr:phage holin family protein [Burkholderiales bacterium]HVJ25462.1 phage holin family protein [Burkholderiales bacterium]
MVPQQARSPGLGEALGRLLADARSLVADFAELAVLDARRAAIRLAWLLGSVLVTAVLVVTTWMALVAAGVVIMLGQGASWATALIVAGVLNVVGAGALVWWMLTLIKEMPFTALLRQMRGDAPKEPQ